MVQGFLVESILGRARREGLVDVRVHDLRDWSKDRHRTVDDRPFGGGAGMLLMAEPLVDAIESVSSPEALRIYLAPDGLKLDQPRVKALSLRQHLVLVSGHYEGIDQRVRDGWIDEEISIGDYVLSNGTLPAAVLIDSVVRQIPGVLGEELSLTQDSFSDGLLGSPQYTRPVEFRGQRVPDILLSGNHGAIADWRLAQRKQKTTLRCSQNETA